MLWLKLWVHFTTLLNFSKLNLLQCIKIAYAIHNESFKNDVAIIVSRLLFAWLFLLNK